MRADKQFHQQCRFDCVKLKRQMTATNGCTFQYARIAWIASQNRDHIFCLAVALPLATLTSTRQAQKALLENFHVVTVIPPQALVSFELNDIDDIAQMQQVSSWQCKIGIINHFYHSNIITSSYLHGHIDDETKSDDVNDDSHETTDETYGQERNIDHD